MCVHKLNTSAVLLSFNYKYMIVCNNTERVYDTEFGTTVAEQRALV